MLVVARRLKKKIDIQLLLQSRQPVEDVFFRDENLPEFCRVYQYIVNSAGIFLWLSFKRLTGGQRICGVTLGARAFASHVHVGFGRRFSRAVGYFRRGAGLGVEIFRDKCQSFYRNAFDFLCAFSSH